MNLTFTPGAADYKLFISEGTELGDLSNNKKVPLTKKLVECSGPAFGSSEFAESFKQSEKTSHRPGVNLEEVFPVIVNKALQYYGIGEESIFSGLKSSAVSEYRAIIAYFAQERLGMPGSSIAENLGLCRSAVSRLVQRGRKIGDREISLIGRLNDTICKTCQQRPRSSLPLCHWGKRNFYIEY